MYDYEARYRQLRAAALPGWAGQAQKRSLARLREAIERIIQEGLFPCIPARALELGCGNGAASFILAEKGYDVAGIDISPTAIAWAEDRFAEQELNGDFFTGDVRDMPFFKTSFFDIVFDGACLHCLIGHDRKLCLAEVRRILQPHGTFIVSSMGGLPKSPEVLLRAV